MNTRVSTCVCTDHLQQQQAEAARRRAACQHRASAERCMVLALSFVIQHKQFETGQSAKVPSRCRSGS